MHRRRFITASAAAVTALAFRHAAAQTPAADPLTGAVNMAQRVIGTGFAYPDAAFDMGDADQGEHYFPQFTFGVTAYESGDAATAAFGVWQDQLTSDPGTHYNPDGELVPRVDRQPFDMEMDTAQLRQVAAWRQPWQTMYPESQQFDAITILARQGETVHLCQVTPGKNGDFGPVEELIVALANDWLPGIDGDGPYDRDALFALLPGEDALAALPGFWRTFAIDEDYGET